MQTTSRRGRPRLPRERYWVVAEIRRPNEGVWRTQGLFVAALDEGDARRRFAQALAIATGWIVTRRMIRRILRVTRVKDLTRRAG